MRVLPASGEQDSEDTFTVVLEDAERVEVRQDNGNVIITVQKKGNVTIKFMGNAVQ